MHETKNIVSQKYQTAQTLNKTNILPQDSPNSTWIKTKHVCSYAKQYNNNINKLNEGESEENIENQWFIERNSLAERYKVEYNSMDEWIKRMFEEDENKVLQCQRI